MILEKKQTRKSPSRTIRSYCHYCVQSRKDSEVENCTGQIVETMPVLRIQNR
jgi:hypothetical protein